MAKATKKVSAAQIATPQGYADVWKVRTAVGALTAAGLIVLGYLNLSAKNNPTKGRKKFHPRVLRQVLSPTMVNHWTRLGRIDDNGLTAAGLNEISDRLNNPSNQYRTTREAIDAMIAGLQTGKDVTIEKQRFKMSKVVTLGSGGLFD